MMNSTSSPSKTLIGFSDIELILVKIRTEYQIIHSIKYVKAI